MSQLQKNYLGGRKKVYGVRLTLRRVFCNLLWPTVSLSEESGDGSSRAVKAQGLVPSCLQLMCGRGGVAGEGWQDGWREGEFSSHFHRRASSLGAGVALVYELG